MIKLTASALFLFAAVLSAQGTPDNPLVATSKGMYAISKNDVMAPLTRFRTPYGLTSRPKT